MTRGEPVESAADSTWTGYSLAERDRRWSAVRANAAQAGFDCVFVPLCVDPMTLNVLWKSAVDGTRAQYLDLTARSGDELRKALHLAATRPSAAGARRVYWDRQTP